MKDIASELDITVDAVSKALRDSNRISTKTKELVKQKALELGYFKNNFATNLKNSSSNYVAVYINSFVNPFFAIVADRIFRELKKFNYIGILCFVDSHLLTKSNIDPVFTNSCCSVISLVEPSLEAISILKKSHIPIYVFGVKIKNDYVNYIVSDDYKGGELVAKNFLKLHKNKAMYFTDSFSETSDSRRDGFINILRKNEIYCTVLQTSPGENVSKQIIENIVNDNIDYIFCMSDYLAIKLRKWILNFDLELFKKVIIVGYDSLYMWNDIFDHIPSIYYDINEISKRLITKMDDDLKGNDFSERLKDKFPIKFCE